MPDFLARFDDLLLRYHDDYCNDTLSDDFKKEAMKELIPILDRGINRAIEELRLVSCKTPPELYANMMDFLALGTYIQKLGLVQASLTGYHIAKLVPFLHYAQHTVRSQAAATIGTVQGLQIRFGTLHTSPIHPTHA